MADPIFLSVTGAPGEALNNKIREQIEAVVGDFNNPTLVPNSGSSSTNNSLSVTLSVVVQESPTGITP